MQRMHGANIITWFCIFDEKQKRTANFNDLPPTTCCIYFDAFQCKSLRVLIMSGWFYCLFIYMFIFIYMLRCLKCRVRCTVRRTYGTQEVSLCRFTLSNYGDNTLKVSTQGTGLTTMIATIVLGVFVGKIILIRTTNNKLCTR